MRNLILGLILIGCGGVLVEAQTSADPKNEFFAGYSYQSADINTLTIDPQRTSQNGINLEYTRNVTRSLGITGDLSAHFHRDSTNRSGGTFSRRSGEPTATAPRPRVSWASVSAACSTSCGATARIPAPSSPKSPAAPPASAGTGSAPCASGRAPPKPTGPARSTRKP